MRKHAVNLRRFGAAGLCAVACASAAHAGTMGPVQPLLITYRTEPIRPLIEVGPEVEWNDRDGVESLDVWARSNFHLSDRLVLTIRLGTANTDLDGLIAVGGTAQDLSGGSRLGLGGGVGAVIVDSTRWNLALNLNVKSHRGHKGTLSPSGLADNEFNYLEWNAGLQLQGKYNHFLPYVGVRYSKAEVEYVRLAGAPSTRVGDNVGVYLGAGFDITDRWIGYVEGRVGDETGFTVGGTYAF